MKKLPLRILSGILALVSIFCLVFSGLNLRGAMDCKDYWEQVKKDAEESFDKLEDGILKLKENEEAYLEGVEAYEEGKDALEKGKEKLATGGAQLGYGQAEYNAGASKLAAGEAEYADAAARLAAAKKAYEDNLAKLNESKAALEEGKKQLAAGEAALEEGKAKVAAGEQELAEHREEYEQGKAMLALVQPIYDIAMIGKQHVEETKAAYDDAVARGDHEQQLLLATELAGAEAAFQVSLGGYSLNSLIASVDEGKAKMAAYEQGQADVEAGRAQIAQAEKDLAEGRAKIAENELKIADAEKKLADAKNQLDAAESQLANARAQLDKGHQDLENASYQLSWGYASYNKGEKELAAGAEALAEGLDKLGEYEGGEQAVAEGLKLVIDSETYYNRAGKALVKSIADRLGDGFEFWKLDEDGNYLFLNGERSLDLDQALAVLKAARDFLKDTTDVVTKELTGRFVLIIAAAVAAITGLLAGILGLFGLKLGAMIPAIISIIAGLGTVILAIINGTECPMSVIAGTGNTVSVLTWAAILTAVAFGVVIVAGLTKTAAPAAAAPAAAE